MSDEKKNLPARQERTGFLDKVRQSKALSATPKKETLAKAIQGNQRPRLLFAISRGDNKARKLAESGS